MLFWIWAIFAVASRPAADASSCEAKTWTSVRLVRANDSRAFADSRALKEAERRSALSGADRTLSMILELDDSLVLVLVLLRFLLCTPLPSHSKIRDDKLWLCMDGGTSS